MSIHGAKLRRHPALLLYIIYYILQVKTLGLKKHIKVIKVFNENDGSAIDI